MYTLPQEVEVWYTIPAIRRELSICMTQSKGVSFDKVGKILGISKAAVSQYVNGKRATKINLHPDAKKELCKHCGPLSEGKGDSVKIISDVLKFIRKNKLHCGKCGMMIDENFHGCKEVKIPGL